MTIEEIKKEICFAEMVLKRPMLVYDEEKKVVKKALRKYVAELESELRGR